ncbi:MAG TPA: aminotransferase class V-fold PLP-dependent enzyme [Candidatus Acidoferrum sp.]|nr:aminotransferase class V-fold PLP-dependent enzyme [Candidatus Acidoferrum sp.]
MNDTIRSKFKAARALFPHTEKIVYFNAASYGPFASTVTDAINENMAIRTAAEHDDSHYAYEVADELRVGYAGLIGAQKRQVGIGLHTTFGLNIAAYGLPLKKGDEILVSDVEFPAVVYTFQGAAKARGLKVRFIKSRDRHFDIDEFVKAIRPKTRVLALSYVQFFNGYKNDLATIAEICKRHHMYFVVDGIQGMGTEPLNVRRLGIDIFASGCQKWMLAPQGCGFFYLSDEVRDTLTPPWMSWVAADWGMKFSDLFHYDKRLFDSARRFEMGYYAVLNLMGMKASMKIFQDLGIGNIQKHNHDLIDRLVAYLKTDQFYRITSDMTPRHRSSIFTFSCEDVKSLHRAILDRKIILVNREGSIRVSSHLYNNESDADRLIEVLSSYSR